MNKREKLYNHIAEHGKNLNAIFETGIDDITLCKKLFRLENKAHRITEDACNGLIDDEEEDLLLDPIYKQLKKILGEKIPVIINRDPRGYALKISDRTMTLFGLKLYQDWGGYGILAPDFRINL